MAAEAGGQLVGPLALDDGTFARAGSAGGSEPDRRSPGQRAPQDR